MNISGIGIILGGQRGQEALTLSAPALRVNDEILKDKELAGQMRRGDRFCKMAVVAAYDAIKASNRVLNVPRTGVIVATSFGPHPTTFKFLDNILEYKENEVSPTLFSHSVHNAAASYISTILKINGPTVTVTTFDNVVPQGFELARAWLDQGVCDLVLLVAVDERGEVFDRIFDITEGAVAFALTKDLPGVCRVGPIEINSACSTDSLKGAVKDAVALAQGVFALKPGVEGNDCHLSCAVIKLSR